ncbi:Intradiol ring-cleavage dioxygenase [Dactylonectria estremocensis]|uniref:Intradiol ring-cleavage dioxygenase n=1 Tax=Dactylonectria estremocensis TaxID=1079267 RepID=A0A9P9JG89_9HYPO|nr:Intradiol ring-cleavage dioxygenase [Dactylonectria estremocensis]
MDPSNVDLPPVKDLTIDNITDNVHAINSRCGDPRMKFLFESLVTHVHNFARETRLTTAEWEAAIKFLTQVGQICSEVRQEFILLSDIIGLSLLVDSIDHPKPKDSTEGTVLGPFHTHEAKDVQNGTSISQDPSGVPMLVVCTVKDTQGKPIPDVKVDVWETDSKGFYDVQYADHDGPDGRAIVRSDETGLFFFKGIVPVPYPIPSDGPVGKLLKKLHRHPYRPSHFHFMFDKLGYDRLITALYIRGDPYERSDAVFGVKESLVVDLKSVSDVEGLAEKYNMDPSTKLLKYDFVLVTDQEATDLRDRKAMEAMEKQGFTKMRIINGVLIPDPDVD